MNKVIQFPTSAGAASEASAGLADAVKEGRVLAASIVTIELDENGNKFARVRKGWDENTVTLFDLLAFSAAIERAKDEVKDVIET